MRSHWAEYAIEALLLGLFMVSAGVVATVLESPGSPLHLAVPSPVARRALMGAAMGLTAIALVYSPLGKRSGAHMNPAMTITYLRLGKVARRDALGYAAAQIAGGIAGVALVALALGRPFESEPVSWVATLPGVGGAGVAFAAELAISFGLMSTALVCTSAPRLAPYTGLFCGSLLALFIVVEAPLSGTSMNPARSLASAFFPGFWRDLWIYIAAPMLGMLAAAEAVRVSLGAAQVHCAKLQHSDRYRCIFCGFEPRGEEAK
jgi:aquaporin Z